MIPVKICGITSINDAVLASDFGASAIGMIFYKESPRNIDPEDVKNWIRQVPNTVKKVGVFVNEELGKVNTIAEFLGLDYIQLHGMESPRYCIDIIKPVIKVFHLQDKISFNKLKDYKVSMFLFDSFNKGKIGGTGVPFDWNLLSNIKTNCPIILSGGLNTENILDGVYETSPSAVDINSSIESSPGLKDYDKMALLFDKLERTGNYVNPF